MSKFECCACGRPAIDFAAIERDASVAAFQAAIKPCPPTGWCMMKKLGKDFAHWLARLEAAKPASLCVYCDELRIHCHPYRRIRRVEPVRLWEPEFLRDAKLFIATLNMSATELLSDLPKWLEEAKCATIIDRHRRKATLDLDALQEAGVDWLAEWMVPPPPGVLPLVHEVAIERVWPMLSIIRLRYPRETMNWGVRP